MTCSKRDPLNKGTSIQYVFRDLKLHWSALYMINESTHTNTWLKPSASNEYHIFCSVQSFCQHFCKYFKPFKFLLPFFPFDAFSAKLNLISSIKILFSVSRMFLKLNQLFLFLHSFSQICHFILSAPGSNGSSLYGNNRTCPIKATVS